MQQQDINILFGKPPCFFYEETNFKIWVEGLFFIKDELSGLESIKKYVDFVKENDISKSFNEMFGNFTCLLEHKGETYVFCDNSGFSNIFHSENNISNSFLRLLQNTPSNKLTISSKSVFEFIYSGHCFTEKILFDQICKLQPSKYIHVKDRKFLIMDKQLIPYYNKSVSQNEFIKNLQSIVNSISNKKISIDLTGGSDTRILTSVFNHFGSNFETAVSGVETHPDIIISKKVAEKLNKVHHISYHTPIQINLYEELKSVFNGFDGTIDVLTNHRLYLLYINREKRNIEIMISGSGGELYKDGGWWRKALISSFKFQTNKRFSKYMVNSGLVNWGASSSLPKRLLSDILLEESKTYLSSLSETLLIKYEDSNRFIFADRLFFEYSTRSPRYYSQGEIFIYSPLLEYGIVSFGVNLKPLRRFSSLEYRSLLKEINPNLCNIPTTKAGTSLEPSLSCIIKDLLKIAKYIFVNGSIKPKMKISSENIYNQARQMPETIAAIEKLKKLNILNKSLNIDEIPD